LYDLLDSHQLEHVQVLMRFFFSAKKYSTEAKKIDWSNLSMDSEDREFDAVTEISYLSNLYDNIAADVAEAMPRVAEGVANSAVMAILTNGEY
jgi:hypothetical protein